MRGTSDGAERRESESDASKGGLRIAIIGVGLIGGSLGMAWRRAGVAREIIGVDGPGVLEEAVRRGAIDRAGTMQEALQDSDVVVLAAPVRAIAEMAYTEAARCRPGLVVTDVGSTKEGIVRIWEQHLPEGVSFVGGHPIFGREVAGVANASADLPEGARYVITPGEKASPEAVAQVKRLAEAAGTIPRQMRPAEHDARLAVSSHLPQMVASALAAAALEADDQLQGVLDLTAGGFRDTTRIASSPANIWVDIFLTNPASLRAALVLFREQLDALEGALEWGDPEAIEKVFDRAHEARRRLTQT
jgi:prephenate dehydrogenase